MNAFLVIVLILVILVILMNFVDISKYTGSLPYFNYRLAPSKALPPKELPQKVLPVCPLKDINNVPCAGNCFHSQQFENNYGTYTENYCHPIDDSFTKQVCKDVGGIICPED